MNSVTPMDFGEGLGGFRAWALRFGCLSQLQAKLLAAAHWTGIFHPNLNPKLLSPNPHAPNLNPEPYTQGPITLKL